MVCRCDTPAPFVPGRRRATSRPPGKAVPAPVRRHARARLCGYALGRMRVHTCASGQARGTPPPRGVHSGGAACTYRRGGVTSRRDGDRLFLRPRAAFSPIAAGDSAAGGAKRPQIAKKRAMRANGGARGAAHGTRGRRVRVHAPATRAMRTSVRERTSQAGAKKRATIWHLTALCLSLLYINQQPQGAAARRWIAGTHRPLLLYRPAAGVRSAERY